MNPRLESAKLRARITRVLATGSSTLILLFVAGCGRSGDASGEAGAQSPGEAASLLENVFSTETPDARKQAASASEALRGSDYERAVFALQIIRSSQNITLEQGLAIHHSEIALQNRIVRAVEAGDEKAKRAYELLKALNHK